jgi:hypothetical protein
VYNFGREHNTPWKRVLENERVPTAGEILSTQATTTLSTMGTTEKILPGYCNVVGQSREKENLPALYARRVRAKTGRNHDGKFLPRMLI